MPVQFDDEGYGTGTCDDCGFPLQAVRPGKVQCNHCDEVDSLRAQLAASETALAEARLETITAHEQAQEALGKLQAVTAALTKLVTANQSGVEYHEWCIERNECTEDDECALHEARAALDAARGDDSNE
jgi:uncharacterized Zn finger protein (UPF0148 family)